MKISQHVFQQLNAAAPLYALRALLSGSGGHNRSRFNVFLFFIWSAPSSDVTRSGRKITE